MPRRSPSPRPTTPPDIRVDAATVDDLRALVDLEEAVFTGDRISVRSWRAFLVSPTASVAVARDECGRERRIVGATVVLQRLTSSVARLYSIAVASDWQGRGLSTSLLQDAAQRMRDAGAAVLRLETRVDNVAAQRLFIRNGFAGRGRRHGYYEDGEDALLFQKSLWNVDAADATPADRRGRHRQGALTWHPII